MNERDFNSTETMPTEQPAQDMRPRRRKRGGFASQAGIFALGMAVGIVFLAVAVHLCPVRTVA